jgi:hypothetical protein
MRPPVARPYNPTPRDKAALALYRAIGDGPVQQNVARGLFGSSGLGQSHIGVADFTPFGAMWAGYDAGRQIGSGRPVSGAANLLMAAVPIPAAAKGAKGLFGGAKNALTRQAAAPVAKVAPRAIGGGLRLSGSSAPLDMSRAARMSRAAEQGFDTQGYHGTNTAFNEFDPAYIGSQTDEGYLGRGFYFGTDPKVIGQKNIGVPVMLKTDDPLHLSMPDWRTDKRSLMPSDLGAHDSVVLDYAPAGYAQKEIMVRSPSQIRSIFDDFNPGGEARIGMPRPGDYKAKIPAPQKARR